MYEVNLRAYSSGGDLPGVLERIDQIAELGVNVIWLMPIHPDGEERSFNSPYAVKNYKEVGEEYGDLEDLRALTDAAHARGMLVIMDWVANHTAWDNPWISNRSWYTQNAAGEIIHPLGTNWQDVADLNFDVPEVREAMIDAMRYWVLEANVDGYRCDAADFVPFDFWRQAIDSLRNLPDRELLMLAEGARFDHFDAGFDLKFGWNFFSTLKGVSNGFQSASRLLEVQEETYQDVPEGKGWLRFITNHDESAWDETPVRMFGGVDASLAYAVANTFVGGVPLIYGSQEVGVEPNIPFFSNQPIDWSQNPALFAAYRDFMRVYTESPAARRGEITGYAHNDVLSFSKALDGDTLACLVNLRAESIAYVLPPGLRQDGWADALDGGAVQADSLLNLPPFGYEIWHR
jgi:glycosidase